MLQEPVVLAIRTQQHLLINTVRIVVTRMLVDRVWLTEGGVAHVNVTGPTLGDRPVIKDTPTALTGLRWQLQRGEKFFVGDAEVSFSAAVRICVPDKHGNVRMPSR